MITFEETSIRFGDVTILPPFSETIPKGEKVLLYGPSGSGKSSILKMLAGFIEPATGTVSIDGVPVSQMETTTLRRTFAYLLQEIDLGEGITIDRIGHILSFNAQQHLPVNDKEIYDIAAKLKLGSEQLNRPFEELSGGEKQRAGIVTALLLRRPVYLLDEVTSSLDQELKETVRDIFLSMNETTVLVVSHDTEWLRGKGIRQIHIGELNGNR